MPVALCSYMLGLARTAQLSSIDSDEVVYHSLRIRSISSRGTNDGYSLEIHGRFAACNASLVTQFDEMARNFYAPVIRTTGQDTILISLALLCRAYLCLLFSNSAVTETSQLSHLAQHVMNFILGHLESILQELFAAISATSGPNDRAPTLDQSAAAGLLYAGLTFVRDGLESGRLYPICVGCYHPVTQEKAD